MKKLLALASCALLFLSGCGSDTSESTRVVFAMDTVMKVTVYDHEDALNYAEEYIKRCDRLFDKSNENGSLYRLNHAEGKTVSVYPEIAEQLSYARTVYNLTGGALNIALAPLVDLWGFDGSGYRVPLEEDIAELLPLTDFTRIIQSNNEITMPAGMSITLGATAKGYTAEGLRSILAEQGVEHAIIELGGNVRTLGLRPDGKRWRVAVMGADGSYCAAVELGDEAAVTSGSYQRFFERGGRVYHHILDPKTGFPAQSGLSSVTVICGDSAYADALSTALFVLGEDGARRLYETSGGFEAIFLREDGTVSYTQGLDGRIELLS